MKKTACNYFWCYEMNCASFNNGNGCKKCEHYQECTHCILMNDSAINDKSNIAHEKCIETEEEIFKPCGDDYIV